MEVGYKFAREEVKTREWAENGWIGGLLNIIIFRGHSAEGRLAIAVLKIMKYTSEECEVT